MKRLLLLFVFAAQCLLANAQVHFAKNFQNDPKMPEWAKLMYNDTSDPLQVKAAYEAYFSENTFEKTVHTQYYKRWVSTNQARFFSDRNATAKTEDRGGGIWNYCGPKVHFTSDGNLTPISEHANVYTHDRSPVDNNTLFCGTESGGVYKSTDAGSTWEFVTKNLIVGGVSAVRCHPTDLNVVLFSGNNEVYKSVDGGVTWDITGGSSFEALNINVWEFLFHPLQPNIVFAATNLGLYRSTDTGDTWTEILPNECMTVSFKPNDYSVVYTVHFEPSVGIAKFYKSTDTGLNFTMYDNGWFAENTGFTGVELLGGHMAVTEADPNRIYVALAGYGTYNTNVELNGWIGLYVSYDGGESWVNNHGIIGTPYNVDTHPNLMNFAADNGTYTQIHYNTTLVASQINPNKVLIGGLNVWLTEDAGATFDGVAGYIGGLPNYHVDQQQFRIYKDSPTTETIWCSNDGGINISTDFMQTFDAKNYGIMAVNLWGYDQGWNEDIMVGGRYHNGNMGYYEAYGSGNFLALGGGEAATGYVNYSDENKVSFSDIGGRVLPDALTGNPTGFNVSLFPNESYWFNESSRILFDSHYYNVAWLGKENKIYKSTNGGQAWSLQCVFGSATTNNVIWIEQSYSDANVLYAQQRVNGSMKLWRTVDGGTTWSQVSIPLSQNNMVFTLGNSPQEFWLGYTNANNSQKVYYTTDGGANYVNWSGLAIGSDRIWSMCAQLGTNAGVYIALLHGRVLYRNASMNDWMEYSSGLPAGTEPIRIVPFYRDNKLRLATWNLGVYEAPLFETSSLLVDFAGERGTYVCPGETIHFVDHSVASANATYLWSFPGATPSTSTEKYPTVVYSSTGIFDVTLEVTDNGVTGSKTKQAYVQSTLPNNECVFEQFESGSIPTEWTFGHSTGGGDVFSLSSDCSAYGQGAYSLTFPNYWVDVVGNRDELIVEKQITFWSSGTWVMDFDVAYAEYGGQYTDTLAVLISTDCGDSWTEMYVKGGQTLATAPNTSDFFIPTSDQWRSEEIFLQQYVWVDSEVLIAFQNRGHWGNNFYIDNVTLCTVNSVEEDVLEEIKFFPNPTSNVSTLSFKRAVEIEKIIVTDLAGRIQNVPSTKTSNQIDFNFSTLANGVYVIQVETNFGTMVKRLEKL
jgi:hypothetical protein